MNYTLHQLVVFLKVAELKSITKASEILFLSQPAVSIQLRTFQDQFKLPLIEVIGKKVYVTEFGMEVVDHAKKIVEQVDEIKNKALAFDGLLYGTIKIAVVSTGKYIMPYFLSDFLNQNKGVKLEMNVTNKQSVIESLKNNEIDFALVSILPKDLNVESIDLMDNILFLVGHENLNNDRENFQEIIEKYPLIFREYGSGTRQTMEKFIKDQKVKVQNKIELTSNEAVKQAILANIGISIMPLIGLKSDMLLGNLQILACNHLPLKTTWRLIWLKDKKLTHLSKTYLNYLHENKTQIIDNHFNWFKKFV